MAKKAKHPRLEVRKADCLGGLPGLAAKGQKPTLIIADPPYNQGMPYEAYVDRKSHTEYMSWTKRWVRESWAALAPHGSLWVFAPDEWVSEIDVFAKTLMYKRQHVIWAFTFGQKCSKKFSRSHCHLLWYTKAKTKFTFNADAVKVPSARQLVYNDKRAVAGGKPPDDTWMLLKDQLEPYMGRDKDTWLESRICGTFKERHKHSPNQIPVPVMARIVAACSNKGELVVDPFAGTCSSGVACAALGRDWIGFDLSPTCVSAGKKRLADALSKHGN